MALTVIQSLITHENQSGPKISAMPSAPKTIPKLVKLRVTPVPILTMVLKINILPMALPEDKTS
jgi:hypothetical protein